MNQSVNQVYFRQLYMYNVPLAMNLKRFTAQL